MKAEPPAGACRSCGAPLPTGAVACAACGTLARSRRALSPPAGFLGGVLGVFTGPVVSFVAGLIGYIAVGWAANRTGGPPQWGVAAAYIGIQLLPVLVALVLGIVLLRAGRMHVGWFLVTTEIMAFLPAAACDSAALVHQL